MPINLNARSHWPLVAVAALMCVAANQKLKHSEPTDVAEVHAKIKAAWSTAPKVIGDWVGTDIPLPTAAVQLLRPNASLNRSYRNLQTGETVSVLAVHCGDARDMEGHYPPNCYPGAGWILQRMTPEDWLGGTVRGTAYEFADGKLAGSGGLWVAGTFILHGRGTAREMSEMRVKNRQDGTRYYGVAQVQVVVSAATSDARKKEIAERFFGAYGELLKAAGAQSAPPTEPNLNWSGK